MCFFCFDCRPDVWPRLPTAALLRADEAEAEGKRDRMTWNHSALRLEKKAKAYLKIILDIFHLFVLCLRYQLIFIGISAIPGTQSYSWCHSENHFLKCFLGTVSILSNTSDKFCVTNTFSRYSVKIIETRLIIVKKNKNKK